MRGRVVDGRTGSPLEQVLVTVEDAGVSTHTGSTGEFTFDLPPGPHRLYISLVGYALERRTVDVEPGAAPVTVALAEGTTAYTETVTVRPEEVFRGPAEPVPSAQVLGSAELMNLRGVLADDPLRAVQTLPGVATGDDLRSEFTVRGSDFRHITFTVDGFDTPYLLHTVRGVEDRGPTGSVAMINSDVLEDVTLFNGGFPEHYGGHTGAEVDFRLREGSRESRRVNVAVSGTSASVVAEGPIGSSHRGSWLASGRQSYLDLVVHHLTSQAVSFGFSDVQGRLAYDVSRRNRVDLTLLAGRSRAGNDPVHNSIDDIGVGLNASVILVGGWRTTFARGLITQRVLAADNHFRNDNWSGVELDRGRDRQLAYRADATAAITRTLEADAGGSVERLDDSRLRRRLAANRLSLALLDDYRGDGVRSGGYSSVTWTPTASLTISPGVRADRWTLASQSALSPWLLAEWKATPRLRVRSSAGTYQQLADFDEVLGVSGGQALRPERAHQYDLGVERRVGSSVRVTATLYDREESDMLRRPGSETRVIGTRSVRGTPAAQYANRLDGYARGVELLVQRSATRGLSGWIGYAVAKNRYGDVVTGETFWGDADQRHTLNAYGMYRRSDRASFVAKFRMGSNFPVTGYVAERDGSYVLTDERNTARLPGYARLDLRANRTFNWTRRRLTLFAEVINVLNRENVRYRPPSINLATRTTAKPFDAMLPIVPSVGLLLEFR